MIIRILRICVFYNDELIIMNYQPLLTTANAYALDLHLTTSAVELLGASSVFSLGSAGEDGGSASDVSCKSSLRNGAQHLQVCSKQKSYVCFSVGE